MKLNSNFIVHQTDKDTVIVPTASAAFSGVVKGNKTLGSIVKLLQNDVTEETIIAEMKKIFDAPEGMIERDVRNAIGELRKIGAIEE
ncbi:MAG: PqqD family protein [Clostridia bacterium]|nr:PqqD family protein [Clostridia bacterium]